MSERLYNLLPAIYRIRDAEQGEPLRALLGVIEEELRVLDQDISGLYEDMFIETCDEWVIPYIGDLIGVHGMHPLSARAGSLRGYVANTIAYRRRKGTAAVLEQIARDVTGWTAHAVEFFELLAATQHLNHLRMHNRTLDLRDTNRLELLGGPFESASHTVDVRRIATAGGKYNIPNIGIFMWRLQSYPLTRITARTARDVSRGYTFDPTGIDIPLFNRPQTEMQITHLAEEINVPTPLRRRPLYDELEARRQALVNNEEPIIVYFGKKPVFRVYLIMDGDPEEIPPEEILICDLSDWRIPPTKIDYLTPTATVSRSIRAAVDPKLGRLVLSSLEPEEVLVSYTYGFSADVGAGPYNRTAFARQVLNQAVDWQVGVSQEETKVGSEKIFGTLADAVSEWNDQPDGTVGAIVIMDSRTYRDDLTGEHAIKIPQSSKLLIFTADWPVVRDDAPRRLIGQFAARDLRPHLLGNIDVSGTAGADSHSPGELVLDGILIEGKITVQEGNLGSLQLVHCTFVPDNYGIEVLFSDDMSRRNDALKLTVRQTICGGIIFSDVVPGLCVTESIIGKRDSTALKAEGATVQIERSTVLGSSSMRSLEASNSIFTGDVDVEQRQVGCMRFCVLPYASRTPRRFCCQPDLALAVGDFPELEKDAVLARLQPVFTSLRYGDPAYAQLSPACAEEIRTGADDGSEMGAFSMLKQPQREANLHAALDEYLRFGLEAGIFYVDGG